MHALDPTWLVQVVKEIDGYGPGTLIHSRFCRARLSSPLHMDRLALVGRASAHRLRKSRSNIGKVTGCVFWNRGGRGKRFNLHLARGPTLRRCSLPGGPRAVWIMPSAFRAFVLWDSAARYPFVRIWDEGYYTGTFSEYDFGAIRAAVRKSPMQ